MERNIDREEIISYLHKTPHKRFQILSDLVDIIMTDYPSHPCELCKYAIKKRRLV